MSKEPKGSYRLKTKEKIGMFFSIIFVSCLLIVSTGPDFEKTGYIKKEVTESGWKEHHFPGRYGGTLGKVGYFKINDKKYYGRIYPQFSNEWKNNKEAYLIVAGPMIFDVFLKVYLCKDNQEKLNLNYSCVRLESGNNIKNKPMEIFNE